MQKNNKNKLPPVQPDSSNNDLIANMSVIDSPSISEFLKSHPDLMKKLKSALSGREFFRYGKDSNTEVFTYDSQPTKFVEGKQLTIIEHDSNKQSWLKANAEKWLSLRNSFHKKLACSIFREEDFSKTYIIANAEESKFFLSELSKFFDQSSSDVQITPHVMEFLKHNKKFSDLKVEESAQEGIWIRSIDKSRFTKLKEEVRKVNSQCYLLDSHQYDVLRKRREEILSPIEMNFQVKGNVFAADIPLVLEANSLTSISCIVQDQSENYPVDNLIIWSEEGPSLDFSPIVDRFYFKVWELFPWKQNINHVVYAEIPQTHIKDKMAGLMEDCLRSIYLSPRPVTVLGIKPCFQSSLNWEEFYSCLMSTVNYLQEEEVKLPHHYIMIIAENGEVLARIKNIFGNKKSSPEELNINVIEGDLSEQKVDIIVNSTNLLLNLDVGATSKALLKKAGPNLSRECKRRFPNGIKYSTSALTKGYDLPSEYVLHGVLPSVYQTNVISTFVTNLLETAASYKVSSIAFPVLGTGQLHYPPDEVAKEMIGGIRIFSKKFPNHSIKEFRIVVFPGQPEIKKVMSKFMTSTSVDIPPSPSSTSEEKWLKNYKQKKLLWILFVNYSGIPENIELIFRNFQMDLEKVPFKIESEDLEHLIFFTDIFSLIPDILTQYPEKTDGQIELYVLKQNLKHLIDAHKDIMSKLTHESLKVDVKFNDQQLDILTLKIQQNYPMVRFLVTDDKQIFNLCGLNWDSIQEAKYLLEFFLGLRENISFTTNHAAAAAAPPSPPLELLSLGDLSVKVYHGDILNMGGIVEAIVDVWTPGVSTSIIKAAGDAVVKERNDQLHSESRNNEQKVILTSAGNLTQYKYIIHAFEPVYQLTKPDEQWKTIAEVVYHSLIKASENNLGSVALPAICSKIIPDIYTNGYIQGIKEFDKRKSKQSQLKEIYFVDLNINTCEQIQNSFPCYAIQQPIDKTQTFPIKEDLGILNQREDESMEVDSVVYMNVQLCFACQRILEKPMMEKKCKHIFCSLCIENPCTLCQTKSDGNHPGGVMTYKEVSCPNNQNYYVIEFSIPISFLKVQMINGLTKSVYIPATEEGEIILKMLQMAFERYLIFSVKCLSGKFFTLPDIQLITVLEDCWNPDCLNKLKASLAAKGITPEMVVKEKTPKKWIRIA